MSYAAPTCDAALGCVSMTDSLCLHGRWLHLCVRLIWLAGCAAARGAPSAPPYTTCSEFEYVAAGGSAVQVTSAPGSPYLFSPQYVTSGWDATQRPRPHHGRMEARHVLPTSYTS